MTEFICPDVQPGDFFVASWGYDQTNIDFYKVISRTKASVRVQKWQSARVDAEGDFASFHDAVVPGPGPEVSMDYSAAPKDADFWERQEVAVEVPAEIRSRRLREWSGGASIAVSSYASAKKWRGKPEYKTASGYGH